ncbi:hypothetical protein AGMMS50268_13660 [Spirochaetia bacterium]|nr:hypothetical protein AGMMS50268_13660 [Spirochaetia bacterium]
MTRSGVLQYHLPPPPRSGLKLRFLIAFIAALALAGCFSSVFEPNYTLGIKGKNTAGDPGAGAIPETLSPAGPAPTAQWAAADPGDELVTLTWTEPADSGFDHVEITWTPADGTPVTPQTPPRGTGQPLTISGLTNGTAYTFTLKTVYTDGTISAGTSIVATPTDGSGGPPPFVAVTNISGVPTLAYANTGLTLGGTVDPVNATNQTIDWSVTNAGTTGATISGSTFNATAGGTVTVTATIVDGTAVGTAYTQDFTIDVMVPVTGITGVPSAATAGTPLALTGTVAPANATNQTIVWSVTNAGTTGATISGSTFNATAGGTVTVRATIANGTAVGIAYTQDFTITVAPPFVGVTNITGVTTAAYPNIGRTLGGTVVPATATNTGIVWSVKTQGGTSSTIIDGVLTAAATGTVTVTATIVDGTAAGTAYVQDFTIVVKTVTEQIAGEMVSIPAGTFTMGSPAGESGRQTGEIQHSVTLSAFKMAKYELTLGQFEAVMGAGTLIAGWGTNMDMPMPSARWYEAILICNKLSIAAGLEPVYSIKVGGVEVDWAGLAYSSMPTLDNPDWNAVVMDRTKNGYRLPTSAEWEYACRAGTTTTYSTGNNITPDQANYYYEGSPRRSMPVGTFAANPWGLYDMHGNAAEFCWDLYGDGNYSGSPQTNPTGPVYTPGTSGSRVVRNGSWTTGVSNLRSARRGGNGPAGRAYCTGFRLVCSQ